MDLVVKTMNLMWTQGDGYGFKGMDVFDVGYRVAKQEELRKCSSVFHHLKKKGGRTRGKLFVVSNLDIVCQVSIRRFSKHLAQEQY